MAWARVEFSQNNFEKVLELLNSVEFIDSQYKMNAESFILRSYYELDGYEDVFYSKCDSFARRCRRDRVMNKNSKKLILNFISLIKQIHEAKYHKVSKKKLLKRLNEKPSAFSKWLMKVIERDIKD